MINFCKKPLKGLSDTTWASQCFRLAISSDNNHAEAYNNLGVLEARKGRNDQAVAFFQTSISLAPHLFEPLYNQAKIADNVSKLFYEIDTIINISTMQNSSSDRLVIFKILT